MLRHNPLPYVFIVVAYAFRDNSMQFRNCICINQFLCNMHFAYAVMYDVTTLGMVAPASSGHEHARLADAVAGRRTAIKEGVWRGEFNANDSNNLCGNLIYRQSNIASN